MSFSLILLFNGCKSQKHPELTMDMGAFPNNVYIVDHSTKPLESELNNTIPKPSVNAKKTTTISSQVNVAKKSRKNSLLKRKIQKTVNKKVNKKIKAFLPKKQLEGSKMATSDDGLIFAWLVVILGSILLTIMSLRAFYPVIGCLGTLLWPVIVFSLILLALAGLFSLFGVEMF